MSVPYPPRPLAALGLTALGGGDAEVTGLSVDSRKTKPGHLFAALPGTRMHGAEFIPFALRMGAVAVLTDKEGARLAHDVLDEPPARTGAELGHRGHRLAWSSADWSDWR